jgi:SAM-dependent methyltransferase
MNSFGWDQIPDWWDEKQGDDGDLWPRALIDPPLLRLAGEVRGLHADAAHLDMLEDSLVDLAICNMALMDIENASEAIQEVARILRPKGRFVASISHPCFDKVNTSGWVIEQIYPTTTIWRKMSHYREATVDELPWKHSSGQIIYTHSYHRPLSWYFRILRASGLVVAALEEPEPTEELLANGGQAPWIAEIPLHCVIEAWKQ